LAVIPYYERMQSNGIAVNRKHFEDFGTLLDLEREELGAEINRVAGRELNPSSGDQCAEYLFGKLRLKPVDPETGRVLKPRMTKSRSRQSTDEKSLQAVLTQHPIVPMIIHWRHFQKLKGTYVDGLIPWIQPDGRIRSRFSLTSSPNGQTAAYDPNTLAIPVDDEWGKEIRRGFVAPEGCTLATFDLDQWFMRILAHLSQDENMISVFHSGEDIHTKTASSMFKIPLDKVDKERHRAPAKRTGFGICNGITGVGLSAQYDLNQERGTARRSVEECDRDIESWLDTYPGVREFQEREIYNCRRRGFTEDLFGRIRFLPNIHSSIEQLRAEAERQSFTHVIQSTAHCIKKMMIAKIWEWLRCWDAFLPEGHLWRLEPILEVHDELLYELTDNEKLKKLAGKEIKTRMETAYSLAVPIGVHVAFAPNWAALQELK